MPTGTISYRIASEVAGIDVGGVRYRATRSSRLPASDDAEPTSRTAGPWTLWHDAREGGAHTVGYSDAYNAGSGSTHLATFISDPTASPAGARGRRETSVSSGTISPQSAGAKLDGSLGSQRE